MAEDKKKEPKLPELFKIHSLVRNVSTRLHRAKSPTRHRFSMLLGGGLIRVARKRPATVTKATLQRIMPDLLDKESRGMLMVTDMTNRRVNLETLQVMGQAIPYPPLANPPLDSAASDNKYPIGELKPTFVDGIPETAEVETPEVMQRELPEGEDDLEETSAEEEPVEEELVEEAPSDEAEPALVAARRKRGRRR